MLYLTTQTPSDRAPNVRPVSRKNHLNLEAPQHMPAAALARVSRNFFRLLSPSMLHDLRAIYLAQISPKRKRGNRSALLRASASGAGKLRSLSHSRQAAHLNQCRPACILLDPLLRSLNSFPSIFHPKIATPQTMPATCVGTISKRLVSPYVTLPFPEESAFQRRWHSASGRHIGRCQAKWSASGGRCIIDA